MDSISPCPHLVSNLGGADLNSSRRLAKDCIIQFVLLANLVRNLPHSNKCRYLLPPGVSEFDDYTSVLNSAHNLAFYWNAYGIVQIIAIILLVFRLVIDTLLSAAHLDDTSLSRIKFLSQVKHRRHCLPPHPIRLPPADSSPCSLFNLASKSSPRRWLYQPPSLSISCPLQPLLLSYSRCTLTCSLDGGTRVCPHSRTAYIGRPPVCWTTTGVM